MTLFQRLRLVLAYITTAFGLVFFAYFLYGVATLLWIPGGSSGAGHSTVIIFSLIYSVGVFAVSAVLSLSVRGAISRKHFKLLVTPLLVSGVIAIVGIIFGVIMANNSS